MKFCIDCLYVTRTPYGEVSDRAGCRKYEERIPPNPVTGKVDGGYAMTARKGPALCGHDAKWFEPRENPAQQNPSPATDGAENSLRAAQSSAVLDPDNQPALLWARLTAKQYDPDIDIPVSRKTHGKCLECRRDTDGWDADNQDWICSDCRAEIVREQELDKFLDDPRRGQAADINRQR